MAQRKNQYSIEVKDNGNVVISSPLENQEVEVRPDMVVIIRDKDFATDK